MAEVAGLDVEAGEDGCFRIARKVAKDRIISTVDPEARHGHFSHNRRFGGYKTNMSIDPDFELIDEVVVTPAAADHDPIDDLLAPVAEFNEKPVVFGDCAYGDGDTLAHLEGQGFEVRARVPPAVNRDGRYPTNRSCSNTRPIRNPSGRRTTPAPDPRRNARSATS